MNGVIQSVDWLALGPVLAVALTAGAVLLTDAFVPARLRWVATWISVGGLALALLLVLPLWGAPRATFCVEQSCSYVVDSTAAVFQVLVAAATAVVVLLSARGTLREGVPAGEYHFLLLCSATGAMALAASRDLITIVVALETVSLPAFALVGLRSGDRRGAEAAMKFFLVSVVSVAVMLFGVSLVYGATGAVHLDRIAAELARGSAPSSVVGVGVVLTLAGLAFKVAAVPFHFWVPDTYVGAPVPVAAFLSVVSKAAGLVGLLLVLSVGFAPLVSVWAPVVAVLAALTMTLGNLVALRQKHAVRLLAWSSVAQAGYLLVPLGSAGPGVSVLPATVAYLVIYAVVNLGAFAVVALTSSSLEDYRGLFWVDRPRALAFGFFLLALAGLPPGVIGLFGKVVIFQAAVDGGVGWLAVVMAVNVVIALAYYLYWTALLFAPRPEAPARTPTPWPAAVAVGLTTAVAVVLSVAPDLALNVLDVVRLPL
ncbi:NADH-quinone oxidoreductase subunit N [Tenggerimyces flavus]|uniref:NADH-quinone oxidoreductase subunit N n=1 Tax=Tenggerimyces flavus TaxID=1708749 RepID=A0ABV7Y8L1_9ACTN|nr:NADH-quinone oxidoreductase subunit N [Tenggerimyces flavus]MBM7791151.1 NADH-quinone oxidoreductase subunit N [Tenggerimyces flavus]